MLQIENEKKNNNNMHHGFAAFSKSSCVVFLFVSHMPTIRRRIEFAKKYAMNIQLFLSKSRFKKEKDFVKKYAENFKCLAGCMGGTIHGE